jgi:hypothetical protein
MQEPRNGRSRFRSLSDFAHYILWFSLDQPKVHTLKPLSHSANPEGYTTIVSRVIAPLVRL